MISGKLGELVAAQERVTKVMWVAMCAGLLVYVAIPQILFPDGRTSDGAPESLLSIMIAVAVVSAVGSLIYYRRAFSDETLVALLRRPVSAQKIAEEAQQAAQSKKLLADLETMSAEDLRVYGVVRSRQTSWIAAFSLNESVGIYGLVAAFVAQDAMLVLPFVAVALLLQFGAFPKTVRRKFGAQA